MKIITQLSNQLKIYFSADGRKKSELRLGEKIWHNINAMLPEPVGIIENDMKRLEEFIWIYLALNAKEQKSLKCWVTKLLNDVKCYRPEHFVGREEYFIERQEQIYEEHLEMMS